MANTPRRRHDFWQRLTDGVKVGQLWVQLRHDAQTSYRLYAGEEPQSIEDFARGRRTHKTNVVRAVFWAIMLELPPVRRVLLLAALVLLVFDPVRGLGILLLVLVLVLEIGDRVVMKRDLEIAREIQLWLLPKVAPAVPGAELAFLNRPANTVSGDFYDAFWRGEGPTRRLLLTVADVAGKGVPAALLMATFQASLHALAAQQLTLGEVAAGLNRYACAHSAGGERFTTAFLAELEPATRRLTYVNAGHNLPLLRRAGGAIERLEAGGTPVGILPEVRYSGGVATLEPGDLLFIFSDGLVEATNLAGQEYGDARLEALIAADGAPAPSAGDLLTRVLRDFDTFIDAAHRQDDVTCLALRAL